MGWVYVALFFLSGILRSLPSLSLPTTFIKVTVSHQFEKGYNVENAYFIGSRGISKSLKQDLKARGAIFEDSPGVPVG